jgi:hypothetical protein
MLVPYEPDSDPRIKLVAQLCAKVGRTDILAFVCQTDKPLREYDGVTYTERVHPSHFPPRTVLLKLLFVFHLVLHPTECRKSFYIIIRRFAHRSLRHFSWGQNLIVFFRNKEANWRFHNGFPTQIEKRVRQTTPTESFFRSGRTQPLNRSKRTLGMFYYKKRISQTLFERARSSSVPPKMIICHDIHTLRAAIMLKDFFGVPVIYDRRQPTPGAGDPIRTSIERKWIRQADIVITPTPQSGRSVEQLYGISRVLSIPDAEQFEGDNAAQPAGYLSAIQQLYNDRIV